MTGNERTRQDVVLEQWSEEVASIKLAPQFIEETRGSRYLAVFEKALEELVPLVKVAGLLVAANEEEQRLLRERKKEIVIARMLASLKANQGRIEQFSDFLTHPYGSLLFHKICRIAEDAPPVDRHLEVLSHVLRKCVIEGKFEQLFRTHKMALDLIEQLTPQDIFILQDYQRWPVFSSGLGSVNGQPSGDWAPMFVQHYTMSKNIADSEVRENFALSLRYLCERNFVVARGGGNEPVRVYPTQLASLVIPYITP